MLRTSASAIFVLALAGCSGIVANINTAKLNKLQVGMTKEQVVEIMGNPAKREAYGDTEFLLYRTDDLGISETRNFTPIVVRNGRVAGWGRNYFDMAAKSKIEADVTVRNR